LKSFALEGRFFSRWFLFANPTYCGPFGVIASFPVNHFLQVIAIDLFIFHVISLGPPEIKKQGDIIVKGFFEDYQAL